MEVGGLGSRTLRTIKPSQQRAIGGEEHREPYGSAASSWTRRCCPCEHWASVRVTGIFAHQSVTAVSSVQNKYMINWPPA